MDYMKFTTSNKDAILKSHTCCCVYCKNEYPALLVNEFIIEPDGTQTAICPKCGADAVIPSFLMPVDNIRRMLDVWHKQCFQ